MSRSGKMTDKEVLRRFDHSPEGRADRLRLEKAKDNAAKRIKVAYIERGIEALAPKSDAFGVIVPLPSGSASPRKLAKSASFKKGSRRG